ncbi:MAG TPA: hypothetical protein VGE56_07920 [Rhodocyclaceae bacterium]
MTLTIAEYAPDNSQIAAWSAQIGVATDAGGGAVLALKTEAGASAPLLAKLGSGLQLDDAKVRKEVAAALAAMPGTCLAHASMEWSIDTAHAAGTGGSADFRATQIHLKDCMQQSQFDCYYDAYDHGKERIELADITRVIRECAASWNVASQSGKPFTDRIYLDDPSFSRKSSSEVISKGREWYRSKRSVKGIDPKLSQMLHQFRAAALLAQSTDKPLAPEANYLVGCLGWAPSESAFSKMGPSPLETDALLPYACSNYTSAAGLGRAMKATETESSWVFAMGLFTLAEDSSSPALKARALWNRPCSSRMSALWAENNLKRSRGRT